MSTDRYEQADDGYSCNAYSDYYDAYNEENEECDTNSQHSVCSLMIRVLDDVGERALAAGHVAQV